MLLGFAGVKVGGLMLQAGKLWHQGGRDGINAQSGRDLKSYGYIA